MHSRDQQKGINMRLKYMQIGCLGSKTDDIQ